MMAPILLCSLLLAAPPADRPPPLTPTQITRLQRVVRRTQDRNDELKQALDERQQQLMKAYTQFELHEEQIDQLHVEIVGLQRDLLANYRDLQIELRGIVGKRRFSHLKKRIDLILKSKKKVQVKSQ